MLGYSILGKALGLHNLEYCFGIVGVPVIELGYAIQANGVKYYGFRNEQQASYAAGIAGYLTQKPGICLVVSGPGHTNAISGIANAWSNSWPMILISGASDLNQTSYQAFQQCQQQLLTKPFCKYSVRIVSAAAIPFHVEKAIRISLAGRPGPVYLELPGDILKQKVDEDLINWRNIPIQLPIFIPRQKDIEKALKRLKRAKRPLLIIGKGAAYGRAQNQLRQFIKRTKIPFLPTPMGKGVIPDSHPLNISSARSTALGKADLIVLVGARLNWILHFGYEPRFDKNVQVIQIDVKPEQMSHNVISGDQLVGDCKQTFKIFNKVVAEDKWSFGQNQQWNKVLKAKCQENQNANQQLMKTKQFPMTYYTSFNVINKYLPKDCIMVAEGANTMDIGRTIFTHQEPLRKLDAGSFGTMGIGIPFALAAKAVHPNNWVVTVMGDSAFGFSGMQCQPLTRYQLGGVIFIINNNGIYSGVEELTGDPNTYLVTALNPKTKYELFGEAFGGIGKRATTQQQLHAICKQIFVPQNMNRLFIVNVLIEPYASKKPQQQPWLTRKDPNSKL